MKEIIEFISNALYSYILIIVLVGGGRKPDKSICASLMPAFTSVPCGLSFGEYNMNKGKAIINGFRFNEALGKEPYADQMLLNVLDYYG